MDPFTIALIGSTALSAYGQLKESSANQDAMIDEASFYAQQAVFAEFIADRDASLVAKKGAKVRAQQKLTSAANGIDLTGSTLSFIDETYAQQLEEIDAIHVQGDFNYMMTQAKKQSALSGIEAEQKALPFNLAGTVLGGTATYAQVSKSPKSPKAPKSPSGVK